MRLCLKSCLEEILQTILVIKASIPVSTLALHSPHLCIENMLQILRSAICDPTTRRLPSLQTTEKATFIVTGTFENAY